MRVTQVLKQKKFKTQKQLVLNYSNICEIGSDDQFQYITSLCLSHNCILHLDGIEQFTQLTTLSVHHNLIQNVSELNKIKYPHLLKLLNVHHNPFALNPVHTTVILQKFQNLDQLDNQKINKQYYQQYFIWVEKIGQLVIPYLMEDNIPEQLIVSLSSEVKKYDPCIYKLNQLLYTYMTNHQYRQEYDQDQLIHQGEMIFYKMLDNLHLKLHNNDLVTCLTNQALQDLDINLFEFQSDEIYRRRQLYANFLGINQQCHFPSTFDFPYFPLNVDYVKSIISLIKASFTRKNVFINNKLSHNVQHRQNSVSNQENTHRTINRTQSSMSTGKYKMIEKNINATNKSILCSLPSHRQKYNVNQIAIFTRIFGSTLKQLKLQIQNIAFNYIRLQGNVSKSIDKISILFEKNEINIKLQVLRQLKSNNSFVILYNILQSLTFQIKDEAFNVLVRLRRRYEAKQWDKSIEYYEKQRKLQFFISLLIHQQIQARQKQSLQKILIKQRREPLEYYFSRWKIFSISEQFYDKVFPQPSNDIKSLASIITKDESRKQPNRSIYILDSQTTLEQEPNMVKKSACQKQNQINSRDSNGTNIYCEYVVMNKISKKKKKKKKAINQSKKDKKGKKQKCNICRDFVDQNGNIIDKQK